MVDVRYSLQNTMTDPAARHCNRPYSSAGHTALHAYVQRLASSVAQCVCRTSAVATTHKHAPLPRTTDCQLLARSRHRSAAGAACQKGISCGHRSAARAAGHKCKSCGPEVQKLRPLTAGKMKHSPVANQSTSMDWDGTCLSSSLDVRCKHIAAAQQGNSKGTTTFQTLRLC